MEKDKYKAQKKWQKEHFISICIKTYPEFRENLRQWAAEEGLSQSEYIQTACAEKRTRFLEMAGFIKSKKSQNNP
jgi:hypothetical protein